MVRAASHQKAPWSRPLADLLGTALDPVLARQGFGESDIVLYWGEIVGERLAALSEPLCLRWPPRGKGRSHFAPATLVVRVEGCFALELQHLSSVVIERVNAHLGFACIDRVAIKQGPLAERSQGRPVRRPPSADAVAAATALVGDMADETLRGALARLGAHVIGAARPDKSGA